MELIKVYKKNNKAQKKYEKTVLKNLSKKRKLDNLMFLAKY